MEIQYDICIIGAGMIGSAAARHASTRSGVKVCLIGPPEPKVRRADDNRDIYGAHYDEGRITRSCDVDPVWATLAQESIKRYRDLEKQSGIPFFTEVGSFVIGTQGNSYTKQVIQNAREQHVDVKILHGNQLKKKLPFMKIGEQDVGILEEKSSGHVSPRNLVRAEQEVAMTNGCDILREVVKKVDVSEDRTGCSCMKVITDSNKVVYCRDVLVTTGAFTNFRDLLPGIQPVQELSPLTVALVEVDDKDVHKLRDMPCIIYSGQGHPEWSHDFPRFADGDCGFYFLPPIKYPNGKYYLKLGHFHEVLDQKFKHPAEVKRWFVEGDRALSEKTARFIKSMFKGVTLNSWKADQCLIVETPPTFQPYIDKVHAHLGVALGGNGFAAKSCDEIGRLAAGMMFGEWNSHIPRDVFKLRTINSRDALKSML